MVEQRAAGVAGVDGGVGPVVGAFVDADQRGGDGSLVERQDRLIEPEPRRVAHGRDGVAQLEFVG